MYNTHNRMSGRNNISQINGTSRRPMNTNRYPPVDRPTCAQHDDLIRYIFDSWNKVSQEVEKNAGNSNHNAPKYYTDQDNQSLKDFEPFDLEAYWGRRLVNQQPQHS